MPNGKAKIRTLIKDRKSSYNTAELETLSIPPLFGIETDPAFFNAKSVALYWSLPDEVYTHQFIEKWKSKKDIFLPITSENEIKFVPFTGLADMQEGRFKVIEPLDQNVINPDQLDVIIVPGIAFDENGNRIGRGKGYYDQYLNQTRAKKIGVAFSFQMFDEIPFEEHDVKLDKVIF